MSEGGGLKKETETNNYRYSVRGAEIHGSSEGNQDVRKGDGVSSPRLRKAPSGWCSLVSHKGSLQKLQDVP